MAYFGLINEGTVMFLTDWNTGWAAALFCLRQTACYQPKGCGEVRNVTRKLVRLISSNHCTKNGLFSKQVLKTLQCTLYFVSYIEDCLCCFKRLKGIKEYFLLIARSSTADSSRAVYSSSTDNTPVIFLKQHSLGLSRFRHYLPLIIYGLG